VLIPQLLHLLRPLLLILPNLLVSSALQQKNLILMLALELSHHRPDVRLPQLLVLVREFHLALSYLHFDSLGFDEISTGNCLVLLVF
jgi:hypothetical protein